MDRIEGGKLRFKNRIARLNRLAELDAPVPLLAREIAVMLDALYLIDAKAVGEALADVHENHIRRMSSYCVIAECTKEAINKGTDGSDLCQEHEKESRRMAAEMDAQLGDLDKEEN